MKSIGIIPNSYESIIAANIVHKNTSFPIVISLPREVVDYDTGILGSTDVFKRNLRGIELNYGILPIVRMNCGPNHVKKELAETFKTLEADTRAGFNAIHLEFSKYFLQKTIVQEKLIEAVKYCTRLNPFVELIFGSPSTPINDYSKVESEARNFTNLSEYSYHVLNTGSQVLDEEQFGKITYENLYRGYSRLKDFSLNLVEYNSDYTSDEDFVIKRDLVSRITIGAELATASNAILLEKDPGLLKFDSKVRKYVKDKVSLYSIDDPYQVCLLGLHYMSKDPYYQSVYSSIPQKDVVNMHIEIINKYVSKFK